MRDKRGTRWEGLPLSNEGQHLRPEAESHAHTVGVAAGPLNCLSFLSGSAPHSG